MNIFVIKMFKGYSKVFFYIFDEIILPKKRKKKRKEK